MAGPSHGTSTTSAPMLAQNGFWTTAHEARTDYSMLLGLIFLLIVGAGPWSLDGWRLGHARRTDPPLT